MEEGKNFGFYLDRTLKAVRKDLFQRLKAVEADITPEQWIILSALEENDGQSQIELANASFKDAPTVSRILVLLENKKLLLRTRSDGDRRHFKVFLTEKGKETVKIARPAIYASRHRGWQGLSEEDYENFLKITDQIFKNYSEEEF
ncbi:MAG: MarR family transcriptional regulator [Bacteroidia bacterium]|nr:MarR family transcriptional regulator [Bacteroidia bacterium]